MKMDFGKLNVVNDFVVDARNQDCNELNLVMKITMLSSIISLKKQKPPVKRQEKKTSKKLERTADRYEEPSVLLKKLLIYSIGTFFEETVLPPVYCCAK